MKNYKTQSKKAISCKDWIESHLW